MGLAPIAYVLFSSHLKHDPADPGWPDRDRFVLSCGHASMLLYSVLHLMGYGLDLDEIKTRQLLGHLTSLEAAGKGRPLIVAEGYMDVIALAQFGIGYAVATLGTATTPEHLTRLRGTRCDAVLVGEALVTSDDPAALLAAMRRLATDADLRGAMAKAARTYTDTHCAPARVAAQMAAALRATLPTI